LGFWEFVEHFEELFLSWDAFDLDANSWLARNQQTFIDHYGKGLGDLSEREPVRFVDQAFAQELSGLDHIAAGLADRGVEGFGAEAVSDFAGEFEREAGECGDATWRGTGFEEVDSFCIDLGAFGHQLSWGTFFTAGGIDRQIIWGLCGVVAVAVELLFSGHALVAPVEESMVFGRSASSCSRAGCPLFRERAINQLYFGDRVT
jgi:hypothetical protein